MSNCKEIPTYLFLLAGPGRTAWLGYLLSAHRQKRSCENFAAAAMPLSLSASGPVALLSAAIGLGFDSRTVQRTLVRPCLHLLIPVQPIAATQDFPAPLPSRIIRVPGSFRRLHHGASEVARPHLRESGGGHSVLNEARRS